MLTISSGNDKTSFRLGCEKCSANCKEHQVRETIHVRMNMDGTYHLERICGNCGQKTKFALSSGIK